MTNVFKVDSFNEPQTDKNVWPRQNCALFEARSSSFQCKKECWYCKYAEFNLEKDEPLEVGLCCWPNEHSK